MEEAFRRARRDPKLPEAFPASAARGLEHFASASLERGAAPSRVLEFERDDNPALLPPESPADAPPILPARANGDQPSVGALNRVVGGKLVIGEDVGAATVEQYRRLAATLHHAQCKDGIKIVMIASALAGEGKTLTAVNLALTLSESFGRRVLLIDADLRRPALHEVFQVSNESGLNDGLKVDHDRRLTVLEVSPRLSLLPAGKPDSDPMGVLTSERMGRVIQEASNRFDWVVIDTPPVGLLPDAHLLARMVNVVVLVAKAGRTPCALIQRAIQSLDRNRIIGVVLNQVQERAISPGGKYEKYYVEYYAPAADEQTTAAHE